MGLLEEHVNQTNEWLRNIKKCSALVVIEGRIIKMTQRLHFLFQLPNEQKFQEWNYLVGSANGTKTKPAPSAGAGSIGKAFLEGSLVS